HTLPLFLTVGLREQPIRPLAVEDLVAVLRSALVEGRLSRRTVPIVGPEELALSEATRRVARVVRRPVAVLPAPVWLPYILAAVFEGTMAIPLVARAQGRILAEGVVEPANAGDALPADLAPRRPFTDDQIRRGLPEAGSFGLRDLRCCS